MSRNSPQTSLAIFVLIGPKVLSQGVLKVITASGELAAQDGGNKVTVVW